MAELHPPIALFWACAVALGVTDAKQVFAADGEMTAEERMHWSFQSVFRPGNDFPAATSDAEGALAGSRHPGECERIPVSRMKRPL